MQKDILFIDAVCKSREKFLIGYDRYLRLIDAENYNEGLKLLREYNFGKSAAEGADLSQIIYAEEEDLIAFIKEYAPKGGAQNYFLLPYDFLNAEALFKCSKLNLPKDSKYLTHEGLLSIDEIKCAVSGEKCKIQEINEAIEEAEKLFTENALPTGALVDTVFTRKLYAAIKRLAADAEVLNFLESEKLFKNISIALRCESVEEYEALKIPCKILKKEQETALLSKDEGKMAGAFKNSRYLDFVKTASKNIGKPLSEYERMVDGYALNKLKETRFFNEGTKPYLLYVSYRKADIKNVRLILSSLKSGIARDVVKGKLRESY